jgi:hypothetical protein
MREEQKRAVQRYLLRGGHRKSVADILAVFTPLEIYLNRSRGPHFKEAWRNIVQGLDDDVLGDLMAAAKFFQKIRRPLRRRK